MWNWICNFHAFYTILQILHVLFTTLRWLSGTLQDYWRKCIALLTVLFIFDDNRFFPGNPSSMHFRIRLRNEYEIKVFENAKRELHLLRFCNYHARYIFTFEFVPLSVLFRSVFVFLHNYYNSEPTRATSYPPIWHCLAAITYLKQKAENN